MQDFLGNVLDLGDQVVLTAPQYRHYVKAVIIAFTPKKVRVEFMNTWNFGVPGYRTEYLSEPDFLILCKKKEWPDVCHESHKNVRSSDSSSYDMVCNICGKTDYGSGIWGSLRKPCEGK